MDIKHIICCMTDYQKKNLKEFYDYHKHNINEHGTRAGKAMKSLGLIEFSSCHANWTMYKITQLGIRVAEALFIEELKQIQDSISKHPDWESNERMLSDFKDKLKTYGLDEIIL